jgi:hypothetical protein
MWAAALRGKDPSDPEANGGNHNVRAYPSELSRVPLWDCANTRHIYDRTSIQYSACLQSRKRRSKPPLRDTSARTRRRPLWHEPNSGQKSSLLKYIESRWFSFCSMCGISALDVILHETGIWDRGNRWTKDRLAIEDVPASRHLHSSISSEGSTSAFWRSHSRSSAFGIARNGAHPPTQPLVISACRSLHATLPQRKKW